MRISTLSHGLALALALLSCWKNGDSDVARLVLVRIPGGAGNFGISGSSNTNCERLPSLVEEVRRYACLVDSPHRPVTIFFNSETQCRTGGWGNPIYVLSPGEAHVSPIDGDGCRYGFRLSTAPQL